MNSAPKRYVVLFSKQAIKSLALLPPKIHRQIIQTAEALALDPRPAGCKKLHGTGEYRRVYSGSYKIIYTTEDLKVVVTIVRIGHRKDVYRGL